MKFLVFSDAHLDAVTAGMRRIDDLERAFDRVHALACENDVERVVFLGDLADPDCGSILVRVLDVALGLASALADDGIVSHWVAGNHDTIEDGSGFTTLRPLRAARRTFVHEVPQSFAFGGSNLVEAMFLPYAARNLRYDPEAWMQENSFRLSGGRVVFGHMTGIDGVKLGSETYDFARGGSMPFPLEECRRQKVDLMFNGHFHREQTTPGGIRIPGSLARLRFDEEHNAPGVLIAEL